MIRSEYFFFSEDQWRKYFL